VNPDGKRRPHTIITQERSSNDCGANEIVFRCTNQIYNFGWNNFNIRPGFGCQTARLKIIEDWKKALDDNKCIAAILMDLSKAFDCLPHKLLLLKLEAYGLSKNSLKLLQNFLENRKQRIRIGSYYSDWDQMCKGVPQGQSWIQFFSKSL
jgi:hypothetical protein